MPLIIIAQIKTGRKVKPHGRTSIIILSLLFAFSLEGVQYFLSYRAFNINDLAANGVGVILGLITYTILKKKLVIVFQPSQLYVICQKVIFNPDYVIDFFMKATSTIKYEVLKRKHSTAMVRLQNLTHVIFCSNCSLE